MSCLSFTCGEQCFTLSQAVFVIATVLKNKSTKIVEGAFNGGNFGIPTLWVMDTISKHPKRLISFQRNKIREVKRNLAKARSNCHYNLLLAANGPSAFS